MGAQITTVEGDGAGGAPVVGATTETLGMALAFVTEFNVNTQIFVATSMLMLGIISQQDSNLRMLEGRTNHLEGRIRNLEGRVNQRGNTAPGADSPLLQRGPR
jgi:sulfite exporter TauE/SafE